VAVVVDIQMVVVAVLEDYKILLLSYSLKILML
jgi:hypothetical protein